MFREQTNSLNQFEQNFEQPRAQPFGASGDPDDVQDPPLLEDLGIGKLDTLYTRYDSFCFKCYTGSSFYMYGVLLLKGRYHECEGETDFLDVL